MPPQRAAPERAAAERGDLLADLHTRDLLRGAALDQRGPRLEHERLHLQHVAPHDLGDLRVREVPELGEDERRALIPGQRGDVGEETSELVPLEDGVRQAGRRDIHELAGLLVTRPQRGQAAVAGDGVQPRLELDRLVARDEIAVCGHEGLLDCVLGLDLRPEHVPAEREDAAVVAVVDGLERRFVATPDLSDETLIGERREQHPRIRVAMIIADPTPPFLVRLWEQA